MQYAVPWYATDTKYTKHSVKALIKKFYRE